MREDSGSEAGSGAIFSLEQACFIVVHIARYLQTRSRAEDKTEDLLGRGGDGPAPSRGSTGPSFVGSRGLFGGEFTAVQLGLMVDNGAR